MHLPNMLDAKKRNQEKVNYIYETRESNDIFAGKKYYIKTYGCQMNVHDSEEIKSLIENLGYTETDNYEESDLIILNTCAIRENAHDKVFGFLGRCKHLKKTNKNLIICLCGCMAQEESVVSEIREKHPYIDIVFGTHRLLSKDIEYKNLGLLIVDEEQRFGVTHKEKIKQYKNDVNVLTLSATPIPRTLKMAMSGLRDLSIIDTAPVNRYPVQTYVMAESDIVVKDAIYKELARKGQIFILYNHVDGLENKRSELQKLVPEARIVMAHGRMNKSEIEDVMDDFINYKYDILLCTTIIETGIDIPNANTLIIFDADRFGLSQLYQIRGRVGRSNKIAYAYLMYDKNKMLNDIAIKRLQAIKEFTELGSGYRIAMRDLSLRGAGDILGSDQAGFVSAVGLDLYMKMVDEEIKKLHGVEISKEDISNKALINVDTHISDEYVSDESLKIEIHQKINEIDSYEKLESIQHEIEDRFGKIDEKIRVYMYEEWFEKLANSLGITKVVQNSTLVEIELPTALVKNLKFDKLFIQAYNISRKFQFRSVLNKVYITLPVNNLDKHFVYYLVDLLNLIKDEVDKLSN